MMSYLTLPISFWGYALKTAMHILNLVPSKSVPNTSKELWSGRKPSMKYLHIWGCPTQVLKGKSDKLETKTEVYMFLGYSKETMVIYSIIIKISKCLLAPMQNFWKMII